MKDDECGTEYTNGNSSVCNRKEKNAVAVAMNEFFQAAESKMTAEMEREKRRTEFLNGKLSKVLVGMALIGAVAVALSFGIGDVYSGILACLMTFSVVLAYMMGVGAFKEWFKSAKMVLVVTAVILFYPYCVVYTGNLLENTSTLKVTVTHKENNIEVSENEKEKTADASSKSEDGANETDDIKEVLELDDKSTVYVSASGKKYHLSSGCAGKKPIKRSFAEVKALYAPCQKCAVKDKE